MMPLDLEKLRHHLNDSIAINSAGVETMTVEGLAELLDLAERCQRYETALREIAGQVNARCTSSCEWESMAEIAREALKR